MYDLSRMFAALSSQDHSGQVIFLFSALTKICNGGPKSDHDLFRRKITGFPQNGFHPGDTKFLALRVFPFKETIRNKSKDIPGFEGTLSSIRIFDAGDHAERNSIRLNRADFVGRVFIPEYRTVSCRKHLDRRISRIKENHRISYKSILGQV